MTLKRSYKNDFRKSFRLLKRNSRRKIGLPSISKNNKLLTNASNRAKLSDAF